MKIVVDENMPKVADLFADIADISYVNGRNLTQSQLIEADALLVRSVTQVNESLLKGTPVKFVGTATIGVDHIDQAYLDVSNIGFASAPGCNADAVADYVISSLSYLYLQKGVAWLDAKIGVIGFGNVGQRVYSRLSNLGCDLAVYDPFQCQTVDWQDKAINFVDIEDIMSCDIICLHAPLTKTGPYPTQNMLSKLLLDKLKANTSIISAGRGGVINEDALIEKYHALSGKLNLVLDVWENEPNINLELLGLVDVGTPHIAGYSLQGREKGTLMVYQAFCKHFGVDAKYDSSALTKGSISFIEPNADLGRHLILAKTCHAIYNPAADDAKTRRKLLSGDPAKEFDLLRKHYVERDEFSTCKVAVAYNDLKAVNFTTNK